MQIYNYMYYWYSLNVVTTSHELYSSFGMQSSAGRGWRGGTGRKEISRSSRAAGYLLSIPFLSSPPLAFSRFILLSLVSSGREDHNQRARKRAFTVLFSPFVLVEFFEGER